jgi:hypothetical protein
MTTDVVSDLLFPVIGILALIASVYMTVGFLAILILFRKFHDEDDDRQLKTLLVGVEVLFYVTFLTFIGLRFTPWI